MSLPKNTETTSVCIPTWLMELVDEYASKSDMSRSSFLVRATRKYLLLKYDNPKLWERIYQDRNSASCEEL